MKIQRNIFTELIQWKERKDRKPLILRGARQVGKSYLAKQLGETYPQFIELNLELVEYNQLFSKHALPEIVEILFLQKNFSREKNTLIFIDEIQESPKAIELLRYFYEDFPSLHIIAAGSLLEFALKGVSFPVGRVEQLVVYPIDFEEFLLATNESAYQQFQIIPHNAFAHETLLKLFHTYILVGGMPEIVVQYLTDRHFSNLHFKMKNLWQTYKDDIEKYAKNNTEQKVIRHIMETAHLENDRVKFNGFGNSNYRSREVGEAFTALGLAKIIQLIYPITQTHFPATPNLKRSPRLQFLDSGILNYLMGIQSQLVGLSDFSDFYRGKIIQHIVTQQAQAITPELNAKPNFWVREVNNSNAEIDLLFLYHNQLVPIEIKSGAKGRLRSLHQFLDESDIDFGIRMCANHFSIEQVSTLKNKPYHLINLPYYDTQKMEQYLDYYKKMK